MAGSSNSEGVGEPDNETLKDEYFFTDIFMIMSKGRQKL